LLLGAWCFFVCPSFAFDLPHFEGQEVVVTALRMPVLSDKSPWKTTVLTSDEFKTTLYQTLTDAAGADVRATGYLGSSATARLRGGTSQQVLVLKDGMRVASPLLGLTDFNDWLLSDIEKIEIVKAPLSSIYGSDATGGVINIISKNPDKDEKKINLSYGTYNTRNYEVLLGGNFNQIGILTSLNEIKSDGFRENSAYKAYGINHKFIFGDKLHIDINYYDADKGVPGVPTSSSDPYSASTPGDRQKDKNLFFNLRFNDSKEDTTVEIKTYSNFLNSDLHQYNFATLLFKDNQYKR